MNRFERNAFKKGYVRIAGIDEAGRGPLAGPVVAAAVVFPPGYENPQINDSKKLSEAKREELYTVIRRDAAAVDIGVAEPSVIDTVNILQATLLAMREAVAGLSLTPDFLLVDGKTRIPIDIPQEVIVKGDSRSVSIAAASIIAKVTRDKIMEIYHRQFPQYNFLSNKGYGTEEHREAIQRYGFCKYHRRSFQCKANRAVQTSMEIVFEP